MPKPLDGAQSNMSEENLIYAMAAEVQLHIIQKVEQFPMFTAYYVDEQGIISLKHNIILSYHIIIKSY